MQDFCFQFYKGPKVGVLICRHLCQDFIFNSVDSLGMMIDIYIYIFMFLLI